VSENLCNENLCNVELLIDGQWSAASDGRTVTTTSNVTGRPIATVAAATLADVDRAVEAASDAMGAWAATSPAQRRRSWRAPPSCWRNAVRTIAALMAAKMGGIAAWCHFNVVAAAGILREAAAQAYSMVGEVIPSDVPG